MKHFWHALVLLLVASAHALAQTPSDPPYSTAGHNAGEPSVPLVYDSGCACFRPIDSTHPLPVSASVSASIAAFQPTSTVGLSVTGTTANVAFGDANTSAIVDNKGSNDAFITVGANPTATTTALRVPAGSAVAIATGGSAKLAAITASSTTTLLITTGTGLPALTYASSGGGSGSNASVSATTSAVPGSATYLGGTNAGNLQGVAVNGSGQVAIQAPPSLPLPSGAAQESGGNLATTAANTGTIAGAVSASVVQGNTKQVNGVTTLAGAGAVGTGAQRIAVGQDTTTIAGSAPGTAGTASANVVTVQGVASMTAVKVDPSGVTSPVSAVSLPLPSGAAQESGGNLATLAGAVTSSVVQGNTKQVNGVTTLAGAGAIGTGAQRVAIGQDTTTIAGAAPGTTGTPSANVVTVQGAASMTAVKVDPSGVTSPVSCSSGCQSSTAWVAGGGAGLTWTAAFATADLNALADSHTMLSSASTITNGSSLDVYADFSAVITVTSSTPRTGAFIGIYLVPLDADGATYGDGEFTAGTASGAQPPYAPACVMYVQAVATTVMAGMCQGIVIPPGSFKWEAYNYTNVAFSATNGNNVASYRTYRATN